MGWGENIQTVCIICTHSVLVLTVLACVHLCKYIEKCHIKLLIDPSGRGVVFPFLFYTLYTQFVFLYSKCISWIIVFVLFCFLTTHYSNVNSVTFSWFPLPFPGWFKSLLYFSPHSHVYYYLVNNCKHNRLLQDGFPVSFISEFPTPSTMSGT